MISFHIFIHIIIIIIIIMGFIYFYLFISMGEVETIIMEYEVKEGPVGKGRPVKQLSQHQAFQVGFWLEMPFFFLLTL